MRVTAEARIHTILSLKLMGIRAHERHACYCIVAVFGLLGLALRSGLLA